MYIHDELVVPSLVLFVPAERRNLKVKVEVGDLHRGIVESHSVYRSYRVFLHVVEDGELVIPLSLNLMVAKELHLTVEKP